MTTPIHIHVLVVYDMNDLGFDSYILNKFM